MKNHKWLLLSLSLLCGNTYAFQPSIEIIEQFDDVKLVAFIQQGDIADYPLWQPLNEEPPLSINKAIQAIGAQYETHQKKLAADAISEIELREIAHRKGYWHYLVKIKIDDGSKSKFQIYVVLMNGKVIPAITKTESYK